MPPRKRFVSRFRPLVGPDQSVLTEHRKLLEEIDRRKVLRGGLSLGALALLSGCDVSDRDSVQRVLRAISRFNDRIQAALFSPTKLAPTYPKELVVNPPRFNAHFPIAELDPVDRSTWKLELSGLIQDKRPWTLEQLYGLPEQEVIYKHICVEGWDYIGQWSGPNLKRFLTQVGADLSAKYIAFRCNDDFSESIDMPSALHPQTILATKYAGEPLPDPFGFPIRLRTSVKLGFKNPKWIRAIEVTNRFPGGFWYDQGFNWFSGL